MCGKILKNCTCWYRDLWPATIEGAERGIPSYKWDLTNECSLVSRWPDYHRCWWVISILGQVFWAVLSQSSTVSLNLCCSTVPGPSARNLQPLLRFGKKAAGISSIPVELMKSGNEFVDLGTAHCFTWQSSIIPSGLVEGCGHFSLNGKRGSLALQGIVYCTLLSQVQLVDYIHPNTANNLVHHKLLWEKKRKGNSGKKYFTKPIY